MPSDPGARFSAQYNDGQTAASQPVFVSIDASALVIAGEDETAVAQWTWDDVRLVEPVRGSEPIRLANRTLPGARLAIEDPAAMAALRIHAHYLTRDPVSRRRLFQVGGIVAGGIAIVLFFVYGLPWIARPIASLVPVAWEEPVGESTIILVNKLFADGKPYCENTAGKAALDRLAAKLTATIETPYTIRVDVADSGMVNAYAAPGGRIVLFQGLIGRAKSPDEVAGVLAHEMTHVHRRHPTQAMINTVGWASLLSVFTGGASLSSEATARLAAHLATSANTRDLEAEADEGAAAMLNRSGIGIGGMVRFFRSIQRMEIKGLELPAYLSSHPQTENRIDAIERRKSAATAPALSDADWNALRNICSK